MDKPILLDLFCGAGGAAKGYYDAGFEAIGVDINPQPHYPYAFIQADALEYLDTVDLGQFSAIHASPVCKAYTKCNFSPKEKYARQIPAVRERLVATGLPWVIENVEGAKHELNASLMLCGSMFGLRMKRHRLFEIGFDALICPPRTCDHRNASIEVYGHSVWDSSLPGTPRKDGKKRPDSVATNVGRLAME